MDVRLLNRSMTEWTKLLSVQVNETTDLTGESRIPTVWIRPDQSNVMLKIEYGIDTNQSYTYNVTQKVNAGNWIKLKISQMNGRQEIEVDYELFYNKTNSIPKTWTSLSLVTGTTNGEVNTSTFVQYRNFEINTCKSTGKNMTHII